MESMDRPTEISVEAVRSRYPAARLVFAPVHGPGPPDWAVEHLEQAALLSIVSARAEFWETNAHVVGFGSRGGHSAHELWDQMRQFSGSPEDDFSRFIVEHKPVVPPTAMSATAQFFTAVLSSDALDLMGWAVASTVSRWDDCVAECGEQNLVCIRACLLRD